MKNNIKKNNNIVTKIRNHIFVKFYRFNKLNSI